MLQGQREEEGHFGWTVVSLTDGEEQKIPSLSHYSLIRSVGPFMTDGEPGPPAVAGVDIWGMSSSCTFNLSLQLYSPVKPLNAAKDRRRDTFTVFIDVKLISQCLKFSWKIKELKVTALMGKSVLE